MKTTHQARRQVDPSDDVRPPRAAVRRCAEELGRDHVALDGREDGRFFDLERPVQLLRSDTHGRGAAATAAAPEQAVSGHTGGVLTYDMAAVVLHVP